MWTKSRVTLTNLMVVEIVSYVNDKKIGSKKEFVENSISMKCHTLFQFKNIQHFKNDVRKCSIQLLISINSSIFDVSLLFSQLTEHDEQNTRMMLIVILDGQPPRTGLLSQNMLTNKRM
jgi:hypothetical protein